MEAQGRDFPVLGDAREGRFPFGESILPVFFMVPGIHPVMKKLKGLFCHAPGLHYLCTLMRKILFVCLGNICRSSAAEEIMRKMVADAGLAREFFLDSAGLIDYHEGEPADSRMRAHAARRGYHITHLSRPVRYNDFFDFDLIVGMDDRNISKLKAMAPGLDEERKVVRMTDYCRLKVVDYVPDPYYGGASGFENVLDILEDACAGLLETEKDGAE